MTLLRLVSYRHIFSAFCTFAACWVVHLELVDEDTWSHVSIEIKALNRFLS